MPSPPVVVYVGKSNGVAGIVQGSDRLPISKVMEVAAERSTGPPFSVTLNVSTTPTSVAKKNGIAQTSVLIGASDSIAAVMVPPITIYVLRLSFDAKSQFAMAAKTMAVLMIALDTKSARMVTRFGWGAGG